MGRSPCCDKDGLKKGPWTPEEDLKLVDYIQKHGYGNWRTLPKNAGLQRCGKSCRLRWTNYLRPDIKRGRFSSEEEEFIIQLHAMLGNKWSAIAAQLPGRTDNEIKNYWNTRIRKRLLRMGIDPVTHNPRLDLLDLSSILSAYHYNPSEMNMSRLLGTQPFVNPELLKIVTSLLSSSRQNQNPNQNQKSNLLQQNVQDTQLCNPEMQNQHQDLAQPSQNDEHPIQEVKNCVSFSNHDQAQLMEPRDDIEQYTSTTFANFSSQNDGLQSNEEVPFNLINEDYALLNYDYYNGSEEIVTDPRSFHTSSNDNQNFGFASVFSAQSSSSDPMNSNSTYVNGSVTEDEKESCCSNMLNFDVPKIFDVDDFL